MSPRRPLLRPAVFLERELLWCGPDAAQVVLARSAAIALAELRRLGFVCVLLDLERGAVRTAVELIRLHERIAAAVRHAGGSLDGVFAYPRPGVELDPGVSRASAFGRLVLEAAAACAIDLARSTVLAASFDAVEGARIAGSRSALVGVAASAVREALRDRPAARPDETFADFGSARLAITAERQRSIAQGF